MGVLVVARETSSGREWGNHNKQRCNLGRIGAKVVGRITG
jgi:hypothetical protein